MHGQLRRNPLELHLEYPEKYPKSPVVSIPLARYTMSFRRDRLEQWIAQPPGLYRSFRLSSYLPRFNFVKVTARPCEALDIIYVLWRLVYLSYSSKR